MKVISPIGVTGRHEVVGEDRYGNQARLDPAEGFDYGLKRLSQVKGTLVFPSDVWIYAEAGLAITNSGYMRLGYANQEFDGFKFPEITRAAAFDIENAFLPQLVALFKKGFHPPQQNVYIKPI
jgi:hypothetical protein